MRKQFGFTLVELLVVAGLIVTISGFVAGVMVTSLRGGAKTKITNAVSQNGNYAMTIITSDIVSSYDVVEVGGNPGCTDPSSSPPIQNSGSSIVLEKENGEIVTYACVDDTNITKTTTSSIDLLDGTIVKPPPSSCSSAFTCRQETTYSPPIVEVNFTLTEIGSTGVGSIASESFSTSATLRNYNPF